MLRRTLVLGLLTIPATAHATAPMNPGGWGQPAGAGTTAPALIGAAGAAITPDGAQLPPHNALVDLRRDDDGATRMHCFSASGTSGGVRRRVPLR